MIASSPSSPSAPLPRFLRPDEIEIRLELQPRVALLTEVVEQYRDVYRGAAEWPNSGTAFPPLSIVVTPTGENLLWDGFHRHAAGRAAEITSFPVDAVYGDFELALRRSLGANARHGVQRTMEDKRRAVVKALEFWPELSNNMVAQICNVTHTMVNDYRPAGRTGPPVSAGGIVLATLPDVSVGARTYRQARLVSASQRPAEPEPPLPPTRILPSERRAGLERMATALEHYLDCGRDLAEGHPEKLVLLILFNKIEEAGDKVVVALGGGE